ncbi:MAG TPA: Ig-like domain-containing protein, partial [Chitinophagaceae bacterium]|nr:Ig-like domain-containing protein [Chitinophagaceae bacterium]
MIKKVSFYFLFVLVFTKVMFLSTGCANIVAPTGGPRDSLPPVLISVTPEDSSLNFTGNRVTFVFNEFVDLQNVRENLIVSPTPKIDPIVDFKLRTVNVRIKDTLEPNTTYSYNFGNSIRDNNEGNQLRNFTYVFSTG